MFCCNKNVPQKNNHFVYHTSAGDFIEVKPLAINTCENSPLHKYDPRFDWQNKYFEENYWAGAIKNMPIPRFKIAHNERAFSNNE